jgi:sulfur relay (sulfurtransferase) DsrF/TusC family protein
MAILEGVWTVIPGQSGGAVLDPDTHKVVGVVNTYDMEGGLSGSVELKRTSVCRNA